MDLDGTWTASRPGQDTERITGTGEDELAAMIDLARRLDEHHRAENDPEMPRFGGRTSDPTRGRSPCELPGLQPPARRGGQEGALDVLVTALTADPVIRWMYPDATAYLARFRAFLRAFGGKALTSHTVWRLGEFEAVALWFPPHVEPDGDAVIAEVRQGVAPDRNGDFFAVLEQMGAGYPTFAHWYLPWLGVEGARKGRGIGGELMRNCLGFVDQDHLPAYLESPNSRNIPFYERHGFEVTGVSQAWACPPVYSMLSLPR